MSMLSIVDVRFEHYRPGQAFGVQDDEPRISWKFTSATPNFAQTEYEIEVTLFDGSTPAKPFTVKVQSPESHLVPWPGPQRLQSRQRCHARVRARGSNYDFTAWSDPSVLETGLLDPKDWVARFITAPWSHDEPDKPQPEDLFRKEFMLDKAFRRARLYVTAHGVYEAEINGSRVGDYFLAPGWTAYGGQLHYQTYDISGLLKAQANCIGFRVAEGWFKGRLGWENGRRNIWGLRTAVLGQIEVEFCDGTILQISTDQHWHVTQGPIRLAELYDGETYDATAEIPQWSCPGNHSSRWKDVEELEMENQSVDLVAGRKEPARRVEALKAVSLIRTPSGKEVLDFGQNIVGYLRVKKVVGPRGHCITLSHAEALDNGEIGTRPLRICKAQDKYILKGGSMDETYEPRFTFHGFRYAQIDNWPSGNVDLLHACEAIICHTDMEDLSSFSCSKKNLNQLYSNTKWSMRGNFLSLPTDCPQRDERLGWTGDLALFVPTATLLYGCSGILHDWLHDLAFDQGQQDGIPPMVSPNVLRGDPVWGKPTPLAVWHDVAILAPWALYQETGDLSILSKQYESMKAWLGCIPRNKNRCRNLWDSESFQLGDWLDPSAPPDQPHKSQTSPILVANAFLIKSLNTMVEIATLLQEDDDRVQFQAQAAGARNEFLAENLLPSGHLTSDSQTAYSLAICFDLLLPHQLSVAGARLAEIARANDFNVGTGFAGTPFVCEALVLTGQAETAYRMLLNEKCPSWLYQVTMQATTIWERWDSIMPDGSINPGDMTSLNHYAFGAVTKFLFERLAGLQRISPRWKKSRVQPLLDRDITSATASHMTPYGEVSSSWAVSKVEEGLCRLDLEVVVPSTTEMEVILPGSQDSDSQTVGCGKWKFTRLVKI